MRKSKAERIKRRLDYSELSFKMLEQSTPKKLRGHATHLIIFDDAAFFPKPSTSPAKR